MKRIIISVTNDLSTDQRVDKVSRSLQKLGFEVVLVGRELSDSLPLERPYRCVRFRLLFNSGPLFYAEYNFRLWLWLLFSKSHVLLANDLDTLLANYLASRMVRVPLVYDSHEYYTEVPELVGRPRVQKTWERIEKWIFPRLKHVYTVNESIAEIYRKKYAVEVGVIHNLPPLGEIEKTKNRSDLGIPEDRFVVVLQGAGINMDRGGEELVEAMAHLPHCFLVIVGSGDVIDQLKASAKSLGIGEQIMFRPKMPYNQMMQYTLNADLGVTLDKDTNLNYRYSLPNKVFDYIKAGIPVLSSNLPELANVVNTFKIGAIVSSHNPLDIARAIEDIRENPQLQNEWSENTTFALAQLNWQKQEEKLSAIFKQFV